LLCFAARAPRSYTSVRYQPDDTLVFGSESSGLPDAIRAAHADALFAIPLSSPHVRSLNLATAVAVVLFEGLRQLGAYARLGVAVPPAALGGDCWAPLAHPFHANRPS
jgi:tRNA (cytidine/uridine-2'-O-)-methyltransferase